MNQLIFLQFPHFQHFLKIWQILFHLVSHLIPHKYESLFFLKKKKNERELKDEQQLYFFLFLKKRPTATMLLKHPFIKEAKEIKGFLKTRIETFEKWRIKGGNDSDSEDSSDESE